MNRAILSMVAVVLCLVGGAVAEEPTPIMPLDEVRVGMKGYGKTVFHGARIEPFAIEVVSVISDSSAKRSTVWVVCPDERMTRSGPVQGMSGSPMFLWDEGEEGVVGEGGRLIGAFAFGYPDVNVCLVGVQPIEYMREVGGRVADEDLEQTAARGVTPGMAGRSLAVLATTAERLRVDDRGRAGLDATRRLLGVSAQTWRPDRPLDRYAPRPDAASGYTTLSPVEARPLALPLAVGNAEAAQLLGPLLAPAGIAVMAGDLSGVAGKPPSNVDPAQVKLEPGSVLSIPLAYGDMDLNAAGTVTDVLPDGTVIAFGHAMNSEGSSRLPMASGYTHFVVSRDSISFKLGSSLDILGTVVRDEASAVAGVNEPGAFFAAPVNVRIDLPGQPTRDYAYHVVDHPALTPSILMAVVFSSLTAVQGPPMLHTVHLDGDITFTGGRTLTFDRTLPAGGIQGLAFEVLPATVGLMQNPFDPLRVESADLSVVIDDGVELLSIVGASLDRRVVQPGDTVNLAVELQPFDGEARTQTLGFTLPTDLPEGDYQLIVSDGAQHTYRKIVSDPAFNDVDNVDELHAGLQAIADVDHKALYVALPLPTPGLAIDGQAMADLPSSRGAVLASTASSALTPYPRFVTEQYETDQVVAGELMLELRVQQAAP